MTEKTQLKLAREEFRDEYKEWARFKKNGPENISGSNPTEEQRNTVRETVYQEIQLLDNIVHSANALIKQLNEAKV